MSGYMNLLFPLALLVVVVLITYKVRHRLVQPATTDPTPQNVARSSFGDFYGVVAASDFEALVREADSLYPRGWHPQGGVFVSGGLVFQSFSRTSAVISNGD